eukprot:2303657-Alexandrium_andersonii.AAC.1
MSHRAGCRTFCVRYCLALGLFAVVAPEKNTVAVRALEPALAVKRPKVSQVAETRAGCASEVFEAPWA